MNTEADWHSTTKPPNPPAFARLRFRGPRIGEHTGELTVGGHWIDNDGREWDGREVVEWKIEPPPY